MAEYKELKPWHFKCQPLIPIIYDDSLSIYENVCKLSYYVNQLNDNLQLIKDEIGDIPQMVKDEVTDQTASLKVELLDAIKKVEFNIGELETRLISFVNTNVTDIRQEMTDLTSNVNISILVLNNRVMALQIDLQKQIDDINDKLKNVDGFLYNPITGKTELQNDVFMYMYNHLRMPHTLTCGEIAAKDLTYGDFQSKIYITYDEFSVNSKRCFDYRKFSPITGNREDLQCIISTLSENRESLYNWRIKDLGITYGDLYDRNITYGDFKLNQNYLNINNLKIINRLTDNTYLALYRVSAESKVYTADANVAIADIDIPYTIERVYDIYANSVDNAEITVDLPNAEVYGDTMMQVVVPSLLYDQELVITFNLLCVIQK